MKNRWRLNDVIDLEYFLKQGDEIRIADPQTSLRQWLEDRRGLEKETLGADMILPGDFFGEIYLLLSYLFVIAGIIIGSSLTVSLSVYTGKAPLNVSVFLGFLVGTQFILLSLLLFTLLMRTLRPSYFGQSVLYSLLGTLITKAVVFIKNTAIKHLSAKRRSAIEAALGIAGAKKTVYGSLFYWSLFMLTQLFGIGFNIGVLSTTVLKVAGSDIAFGWQSTLQFSHKAVYELVKYISLPWSWAVPPDIAHPSLAQIEGSRMILKDGIWHHATSDLASWWTFVCFVVLFYGFMPRLILFCVAYFAQKWRLKKLDFSHIKVKHQGLTIKTAILIPDEIFEKCQDDMLEKLIRQHIGDYKIEQKLKVDADKHELAKLKDIHLFILLESWQPPIKEILSLIQSIRKNIGAKSRICIILIGRPKQHTVFTKVKEEEFMVWTQKITSLSDPYLSVERLVRDDQ